MTIAYFMVNSGFKEERWGRMMFLSLCFHLVIFSMFLFFPQAKFCLDNAAMVAGLGYQYLKKNKNNRGVRGGKSNS